MDLDESLGIYGACGDVAIDATTWLSLLTVAKWYGWTPAGTEAPDDSLESDGAWNREYFPPAGQTILESDAKALARALNRALPDIPDGALERSDVAKIGTRNPLEQLGRWGKPFVIAFLEHCYVCSWDGLSIC